MNALAVDQMTPLPPPMVPPALPELARPIRFERSIDLAALPTAMLCAQLFVASTLEQWGARFLEADAELLAGELVRYSVATCGVIDDDVRPAELEDVTVIRLRLLGFEQSIGIEVWDTATEPVRLLGAAPDDGHDDLALVDARATNWGSAVTPHGRVTWAELGMYERTGVGLPRRSRRRSFSRAPASTEAYPSPEMDLLRRVRDKLGDL